MNYEEFIDILNKNEYHPGYEETINQKLPVLQFYLSNYGPVIQVNGQIMDFKNCKISSISTHEDWLAMNQAFESLVNKFKKPE